MSNTTTTKHTAEPWDFHEDDGWLVMGGEAPIASVFNSDDFPCTEEEKDVEAVNAEAEADGKRIVACVNACAGMEDPAAEIARLREIEFMYQGLCK